MTEDLDRITCGCGHREQLHAHPRRQGDRWCAECQKFCASTPERTTTRAREAYERNRQRRARIAAHAGGWIQKERS